MSGKLDKALDELVKGRRQARRPARGTRRANVSGKAQAVAPVGGVSKTIKSAKVTGKTSVSTIPVAGSGESKIIVSGLPSDVTETQIKDYFGKTIGPVRRAMLTYGQNGVSKGVATIIFNKPGSAAEAAAQLNGVKVDNRAMKIEVILSAAQAPLPVPAKGLGDRIAKQTKATAKAQPKPASKATTGAANGRRGRRPRTARGKPKTAEELDAEMVDYFDANANGTTAASTNGAINPAVAAGGDTGMDDEIL